MVKAKKEKSEEKRDERSIAIPVDLHRRLKIVSVTENKKMKILAVEAIEQYLKVNKK